MAVRKWGTFLADSPNSIGQIESSHASSEILFDRYTSINAFICFLHFWGHAAYFPNGRLSWTKESNQLSVTLGFYTCIERGRDQFQHILFSTYLFCLWVYVYSNYTQYISFHLKTNTTTILLASQKLAWYWHFRVCEWILLSNSMLNFCSDPQAIL